MQLKGSKEESRRANVPRLNEANSDLSREREIRFQFVLISCSSFLPSTRFWLNVYLFPSRFRGDGSAEKL